jgi:hypothetical protein
MGSVVAARRAGMRPAMQAAMARVRVAVLRVVRSTWAIT